MIKTFKVILVAALLAVGMSSCFGGDDDTTRSASIMNCFASVESFADRQTTGFSGLSYDIKLNYTKGTAEVSINNFKLPDGTSYSSVKLSDMKFSINKEGWIEITQSSILAEAGDTDIQLSSVDIRLCDRPTSEGSLLGFFARYVVDAKYSVLSASAKQVQFGKTTSTSSAGQYETTAVDYVLGFNAVDGAVNILMKNCRFVENMPAMNILLEKVPFTVSGSTASFNVSSIVPKIGDTPFPGFTIENLSGYYDFSSGFVASFKCTPETMPLAFTVNIDCKYTFTK
ncbi:MAG: hypothetical protein K2I39_00210 [Muribaculaceae bacterium]|nr:hypothetical protein [Muribaculaceae bacterium]